MWNELEIQRRDHREPPRRIPVSGKRVRIGSSLRNDIILLDRSIPARAGEFQKVGLGLRWLPDGADAPKGSPNVVQVGPYEIKVRRGRAVPTIVMGLLLVGVTFEFVPGLNGNRNKTASTVESLDSVEIPARGPFMAKQGLSFQFAASKGQSFQLHYSIGNVAKSDDVFISINGRKIAFAPECNGRWAIEERLSLPKNRLRAGTNTILFHHVSSAENVWGVRDIYVRKQSEEQVGSDDPALMVASADKLFRLRASRPGQLVRARQLLDRAIGGYKAARGTVPKSAIALQWEISRAAENLVSEGLSEAKSAVSLGDHKKAIAIYDQLLDELVDPTDPRKQEVLRARKEVLK